MLPEGVISTATAIRADSWQPQKTDRKAELVKILTSACCTRQSKHTDIKRVAYNHVAAILKRCQKGQKCVVFLLPPPPLRHTFLFLRFLGLQIQT